MKYALILTTIFSLAMVFAAPAPQSYWWAVALLGGLLNALVVGINGWKMPVKGVCFGGPRHQPMTADTRFKCLADIIPTGMGKASVGDFAICAGVLGIIANRGQITLAMTLVALWLLPWMSGCGGGFRLFEKWTREERKDARKNIPIVCTLLIIGNLLGIHGCHGSELMASVESARDAITPARQIHAPKTRLLTKLVMHSPQVSPELRKQAVRDAIHEANSSSWEIKTVKAADGKTYQIVSFKSTPHDQRQGPFCRVTCSVHHASTYDVETDAALCKANWIPPDADMVPGWISQGGYDYRLSRPGPGQQGSEFQSYKLYWAKAELPAKVKP